MFPANVLQKIFSTTETLPPKEAYDLWASTYDARQNNPLILIEERILLPYLNQLDFNNKTVVDFGCGTGRYFDYYIQHGAKNVVGLDFSRSMLLQAQQKYGNKTISLLESFIDGLPMQANSCDIGISTLVLGYVSDLKSAIGQMVRVLHKGGTLLISDFHPSHRLTGWKRNFVISEQHNRSKVYNISHFNHTLHDYQEAFRQHYLKVEFFAEPVIDHSLEDIFHQIGMLKVYRKYFGSTILLIFQLRKK